MTLTDEEKKAIKRGQHPVSDDAMRWAGEQIAEIETMRASGIISIETFKSFDELRAEVHRRYPHLAIHD